MTDTKRPAGLELPWHTIGRVIAAAALVWGLLQLVSLFLLVVVAVLLAVALEPIVESLPRALPRGLSASVVVFVLVALVVGFAVTASSQLTDQSRLLGSRLVETEAALLGRLPPSWVKILTRGQDAASMGSSLAQTGLYFMQTLVSALVVFFLAVILTLYLLIEGKTTYAWLLAFVPHAKRRKVALTAEECRRVILGYVAGNLATSVFAALFVFATLSLLHVPAALLLALLAGVSDFVPVLGFAVSALPAVALATSVSPVTALTVALAYGGYHLLENYVIGPYVYGDRLRLSNLAVVLAFAAGAELAGVVGALIALPIAAAYPAVERIWLRDAVGPDAIEEHAALDEHGTAAGVPASVP